MVISTNAVALAAAIGGPVVGVAAIVAGVVRARGDREHALKLAQEQHWHERQLASGARLFDRRAGVYVEALALSHRMLLTVERTNPVISFGPEEPPEPLAESYLADLQARVSAHGSPAVWEHLVAMSGALRNFQFASADLDRAKAEGTETVEIWKELDRRRAAFAGVNDKLRTTIQTELETL